MNNTILALLCIGIDPSPETNQMHSCGTSSSEEPSILTAHGTRPRWHGEPWPCCRKRSRRTRNTHQKLKPSYSEGFSFLGPQFWARARKGLKSQGTASACCIHRYHTLPILRRLMIVRGAYLAFNSSHHSSTSYRKIESAGRLGNRAVILLVALTTAV